MVTGARNCARGLDAACARFFTATAAASRTEPPPRANSRRAVAA